MITQEKSLTPQESLQLISEAIAMTKENIKQNSFPFLLWGWLISIASFSFFFLHQYTSSKYYFLPFPFLAIIGIITTIIYYRKNVSNTTISYLSNFLYKMWMVLGLSFFTVVFINVYQFNPPFTYTLLIAAIGTLVSGLVMKFQPLIIGGILFFVASVASVFIAEDYKVLLHGVAIIFGYIIPGYLLKFTKS
ncbi:hypothetical protein [Flavobacterium sp. JAS]|uniref:hypothetical protein n=1 Tax=Flavobacterium sp. JAS TaxID=2897329 RepID=UPI001E41F07F|nr:hypothetical protein [Flavobacterium sp. JAS]MCD0468728.1 hypothetical protein [Flavobacterium sp. JAS]